VFLLLVILVFVLFSFFLQVLSLSCYSPPPRSIQRGRGSAGAGKIAAPAVDTTLQTPAENNAK
jgi:hypothetical protein